MKEKISKIIYICLNVILVLAILKIGYPIKENFIIVKVSLYILMILFIIVNWKDNLFCGWLDILLFLFCLTPLIPLVSGSAIDTYETLVSLSNMLAVFSFYYLSRKLIDTPQRKNTFFNIIIIGSVFIVILRNR